MVRQSWYDLARPCTTFTIVILSLALATCMGGAVEPQKALIDRLIDMMDLLRLSCHFLTTESRRDLPGGIGCTINHIQEYYIDRLDDL